MSWYFIAASCCRSVGPRRAARGPTLSQARAAGLRPIRHVGFVPTWAKTRVQEERVLLKHVPQLPDLQRAWLLLAFCAAPRANHALRTLRRTARRCGLGHFGHTPGRHAGNSGWFLLPGLARSILGGVRRCPASPPPAPLAC